VFTDLAARSRDAAIQALGETNAPLGQADELVAAVTGPALKAVVVARVGLITAGGHTAETDDFLPIGWLPMEARQCFEAIRGAMMEEPRDLAKVRKLLVDGAAFAFAAIDRLDRAMQRGES
jgi:hypothetical protein